MSYFTETKINSSRYNDPGIGVNVNPSTPTQFYEIEEAVVLDVIYSESHPSIPLINKLECPDNYKGESVGNSDKNYTYIGRALVRLLKSQQNVPREKLYWAAPINTTGVIQYPVLNEIVLIAKYRGQLFYINKLDFNGYLNNNSNLNIEKTEGNTSGNRKDNLDQDLDGPVSLIGPKNNKFSENRGILGSYFLANNKVRRIKKYEGDTSIESRHGQSIRFSAYDDNRANDKSKYIDYSNIPGINKSNEGCGNPMIIIRNRQRKLSLDTPIVVHELLPPIPSIKDVEKNVGGLIEEDINHDGSSIHITSGLTISKWKTTVYKSIFSVDSKEEQNKYFPDNATKFKIPTLNGDQIVINSDRIIISSRFGETLNFSKKRYSVITDSEFTVDADDQIVLTTNKKTVINSPSIYLGQYDETKEPVLLGQTMVDWLYDLCEWLKLHTHHYIHTHPRSNGPSPPSTQTIVQVAQLEQLQARLKNTLSRRVFVTGGGYAPGANGVSPKNTDSGVTPVQIDTDTGKGVPGGFFGQNSKKLNK